MGYSDITNLHIAIRQRTGLATLHGPGLGSMGIPERTAFTWDSALDAFMKGAAGRVPRDPDDPYVRAIAPGKVTAPIVGGNLFTFVHLLGTPFEPVFDGAILFFEEVHEPTYVIEVHLDQLRLAGKLEGVAGIVIGEMKDCGWREERPETPRDSLARGCVRAASSVARGPGAIQASSRPREAPGLDTAGGHRDPGCGRKDTDDRPTGSRTACVRHIDIREAKDGRRDPTEGGARHENDQTGDRGDHHADRIGRSRALGSCVRAIAERR